MTGARHEPLTQEERELAERLARLGASGEPPAALDARILAAAHGAVAARPRKRGPRWPLALGAVATLALAIGIAWQLRPSQEQAQIYSEAPAAARAIGGSGPSAAEELPVAAAVAPQTAPTTAPPEPATEAAPLPADVAQPQASSQAPGQAKAVAEKERDAFPASERSQARVAPAPPPPPDAQDIVFDAAEPVDVPPVQAPAPAPSPVDATENAATAGATASARRESAPEAKTAADEETALDQITVTGTRVERDAAGFEDQAIDDQPPATADSPAVQRAWLQQIRELVAGGEVDAARESLAEFKRRYPHYALPDDLAEFAP
jgi:hypothetical protein